MVGSSEQPESGSAVSSPPRNTRPPRVLLAKIGLDGHDRGVKVLARSFRDAGMDVIYTGLWQTCEGTMQAALQEDVDVVGVSLLSAAHMKIMPELIAIRRRLQIEAIPVVLGGIVPVADHPKLAEIGVASVFNPGSSLDEIIAAMRRLADQRPRAPVATLCEGYRRGDRRALAGLLTALQRGEPLDAWKPPAATATVLGITGAPGVGKSSFIGELAMALRKQGQKVAVLAVDPSSPVTGGALLGDRLRMMGAGPDDDFFIRSIASGQQHGGLAPHCREIVAALAGFGFDFVLVETVGAGQTDVAISELAREVVLVLMPGAGDSIQFSKAGLMEIATCFVVNKCDLSGADVTVGQLQSTLRDDRPVWRLSALRHEGIEAITDWALRLRAAPEPSA